MEGGGVKVGVYGGGQKGSVASSLFCLPQSAFIRG